MADLTIKIKGDSENAKKALTDVGAKFEEISSKGQKSVGVLDIAFGSFLGNLAGDLAKKAFSAFGDFFSSAIKESTQAEVELNKFNTALALSGKYSQATSDDFVAFADSLERTTTFAGGAILENAALIQSMGKLSEDGLKEATLAATNLSAALGIDLSTAAQLIGKASTGSVEALGKLGIRIKTTGDDAKDFAEALKQINQFQGAAEAQTMTFQGAMAQFGEALNAARESLGNFITQNPIVIAGIQAIKDVFYELKDILGENQESINQFTADGVQYLITLIPSLINLVGELNTAFVTMKNSVNFVADAVLASAEAFFQFKQGVQEIISSTNKFLGMSSSDADKAIQNSQKQIESIKLAREANDREAAERLRNAETFAAKTEEFARSAQDLIQKRFDRAKNLSDAERKNFLENLSKQNEGIKALTKSQVEEEKKRAQAFEDYLKIREGAQASHDAKLKVEREKQFKEFEKTLNQNITETYKKMDGVIAAGFANPFADTTKGINPVTQAQKDELSLTSNLGTGLGVANNVLNGADGAKNLLGLGGAALGDAFLPGLGSALGPLLQQLSGGPEQTKAMVKSFAEAVPALVDGLIAAIPALIEEIAVQLPVLIDSLVQRIPDLINALVEAIPNVIQALINGIPQIISSLVNSIPEITMALINAFVLGVPEIVWSLAQAVYDALADILESLNPFGDDGWLGDVGGFFEDAGGFLGFSEGGQGAVKSVPDGFPMDTFPARLSTKELVIDRTTTDQLKNFLSGNSGQMQMLSDIKTLLAAPISVVSEVKVDSKKFADIFVDLERKNTRLQYR